MIAPSKDLPVAVIGGGPVGMAAAAQLATRGLPFVVLEAGDAVGASLADLGHVRLFSPWRFDTDSAARALLEPTGSVLPDPQILPTGADLVAGYLAPLAAHPAIAPSLRFGVAVTAVGDGAVPAAPVRWRRAVGQRGDRRVGDLAVGEPVGRHPPAPTAAGTRMACRPGARSAPGYGPWSRPQR
jgi:cation diffusion facilitator CzcD-associated flavoprotein CzcO